MALEQGKEEFLEERRLDEKKRSMDDIHGRMSWWACFNKKEDTTLNSFVETETQTEVQ